MRRGFSTEQRMRERPTALKQLRNKDACSQNSWMREREFDYWECSSTR
jgi:hypothetical protein